ncbi:MAG: chorismate mutase [Collinsella intestinalis]
MALAKDVARVKSQTGRAIFDPEREQRKIDDERRRAPHGLEDEAEELFRLLMDLSKRSQEHVMAQNPASLRRAWTRLGSQLHAGHLSGARRARLPQVRA